jgi:hypothetical protein
MERQIPHFSDRFQVHAPMTSYDTRAYFTLLTLKPQNKVTIVIHISFQLSYKKSHHLNKDITSPRESRDWKNDATSSKKRIASPYNSKSQKININMEIKNFNIFNAPNENPSVTKDLRKKKLHKKTISCLNSMITK